MSTIALPLPAFPIAQRASTDARPCLESLRDSIKEWQHIPNADADLIDFTLAVYASHKLPGDPLWASIVDASGGGKTEILRSLEDRKKPETIFVSKLTEKSLKSGFRLAGNKDPSLLVKLDEKVLIIKDLSPLLAMRAEARSTITGDLRDAYDGFSNDGFGNIDGVVSYRARFSLLAASTLAVDRYDGIDQELGERFIKFRGRGNSNRAKVYRAIKNVGRDCTMRGAIKAAVHGFLDALPLMVATAIPDEVNEQLVIVSDVTATARSTVARNRKHELQYLPRPEVGTRLGKELTKLLLALAHVRGKTEPDADDLKTVCRVAEDCLPPNRLLILRDVMSGSKLAEQLPASTARYAREDLKVLGILDDKGLAETWKGALENVRLYR